MADYLANYVSKEQLPVHNFESIQFVPANSSWQNRPESHYLARTVAVSGRANTTRLTKTQANKTFGSEYTLLAREVGLLLQLPAVTLAQTN